MIRARLSNGSYLMGLDAENIKRLTSGQPIEIDLTVLGGTDKVLLVYGETMQAIMDELQEASGQKLPTPQPMPKKGPVQ
jgi:hypothetical protein